MSCLAAQQVHSKGKMDSLVSANQCFLVCLLWWIASGAFRLTKNEAVIYEVYPSRWTNDQPPCVSAEIRADQTATTSLLHTWKLHRFWPLESHFYFFLLLSFIRHQQKSLRQIFVKAGTFGPVQFSSFFKLISVQRFDSGSSLNPNKKWK